jgi:FtsH-binding integral membrane protein
VDIGKGAGLSGASGVRPFLPALLAGALAKGNDGIDFSGTSYSFLERTWFLLLVLVLAFAVYALERRSEGGGQSADGRGQKAEGRDLVSIVTGLCGLVLGALLFAGALADKHHTSWWGIPAGVACAALGYFAVALLFERARRRVSGAGGALALLGVYADGIALALAGLSILIPPIAYAALVVFALLIVRSRSERVQKFAGLRILR